MEGVSETGDLDPGFLIIRSCSVDVLVSAATEILDSRQLM